MDSLSDPVSFSGSDINPPPIRDYYGGSGARTTTSSSQKWSEIGSTGPSFPHSTQAPPPSGYLGSASAPPVNPSLSNDPRHRNNKYNSHSVKWYAEERNKLVSLADDHVR